MNKNTLENTLDTDRFSEMMANCTSGNEVISGTTITELKKAIYTLG